MAKNPLSENALGYAASELMAALRVNPYHCLNHGTSECPACEGSKYCHMRNNCSSFRPNDKNIKRLRQLEKMLTHQSKLRDRNYVNQLCMVL